MAHFVDRDAELDHLTDSYDSERAEFVVAVTARKPTRSRVGGSA